MKALLTEYRWIITIILLIIVGIIAYYLRSRGFKNAITILNDNELLTQGEIDAFMTKAKDRHLSELIDKWGKKKFGKPEPEYSLSKRLNKKFEQRLSERFEELKSEIDRSENKRGFQNRSDVDSVNMEFMNTIH